MIGKILKLIVADGILDKNEIAHRVGLQVETLDDIIRLLVDRGLLRMEENGCNIESTCSGCHSTAGCDKSTSTSKAFYVTERGRKYAVLNGGGDE